MTILKIGSASTLDVTDRVKSLLPQVMSRITKELKVSLLFDQSVFVRAAVQGVVKEAVIAAGLTALMILLFLGSWRTHADRRHQHPALDPLQHHRARRARSDAQRDDARRAGARGRHPRRRRHGGDREHPPQPRCTRSPSFRPSSTVRSRSPRRPSCRPCASASCSCRWRSSPGRRGRCSCRSRWRVVFAMLTSYILSRTLVPTLVRYLLAGEAEMHRDSGEHRHGRMDRLLAAFNRAFDRLRDFYGGCLAWALPHRAPVVVGFLGFVAASLALAAAHRSRLLPGGGRGAHQAARARRPRAPASRRRSGASRRSKTRSARSSRRRDRRCSIDIWARRQRHQPVAQRGRAHLVGRRSDPHLAEGGSRADGEVRARRCARCCARSSPDAPSSSWRRTSRPRC